MVERILGKAEVVSSISPAAPSSSGPTGEAETCRLLIPIAKRWLAERAVDAAGNRVANPDQRSKAEWPMGTIKAVITNCLRNFDLIAMD